MGVPNLGGVPYLFQPLFWGGDMIPLGYEITDDMVPRVRNLGVPDRRDTGTLSHSFLEGWVCPGGMGVSWRGCPESSRIIHCAFQEAF